MTSKILITARRVAALAIVCGLFSPVAAAADVVLDWNATAESTMLGQSPAPNPFSQARFMAITQLAVFEAVNAVTGKYQPYLGTIDAPEGASAEAAAIAAAHAVLLNYFPASATSLNDARASSLATIPDGQAKEDGIATGEAAAAAMILLRANDGSAPAEFFVPASPGPGVWEATPSCPTVGWSPRRNPPPLAQCDAVRYPPRRRLSRRSAAVAPQQRDIGRTTTRS